MVLEIYWSYRKTVKHTPLESISTRTSRHSYKIWKRPNIANRQGQWTTSLFDILLGLSISKVKEFAFPITKWFPVYISNSWDHFIKCCWYGANLMAWLWRDASKWIQFNIAWFRVSWKKDRRLLWSASRKDLSKALMNSRMKQSVLPSFSIGIWWSF